ncbi:gamma-glutamyltransferase family protein [Glaciecola petra]|uniref:Gamma-glutamyltransferase n=1 Tax=Glaciecola petra TaxID=3075602 RepID=A0ABU2ZUA3_9ALTE|nr:gamma-glutamyltransferase [Aestuariibacter sp. P117]MDT0596170.1 gamma-glutamyltransferase [Aestuariibacter sp. P117]
MKKIEQTQIAFTAPHFGATTAGRAILEAGGTAIEAMVAAAASVAVEYPHMNGMGGDGFWLISEPGKKPIAIDACGVAAAQANVDYYQEYSAIPSRGPKAALTMAGAVAGWEKALEISHQWQPNLPLAKLFDTAIGQAQWGIEVTQSMHDASVKTFDELSVLPHFEQFLIKEKVLKKGKILKLPKLASTLKLLAKNGLRDFYEGAIANLLAQDLQAAGSPITLDDFKTYRAQTVTPLSHELSTGTLYNLPAPTQGIASIIILALYDKLVQKYPDLGKNDNTLDFEKESKMVHLLVECTKQAFIKRDQFLTDPSRLKIDLLILLSDESIDDMLANIDVENALPWPHQAKQGDTVWMSACDSEGRMVSYIQSLYWEYGSGVVSPSTGIVWNNRGTSFSLEKGSLQQLVPGLKPFHTLNPAFAELSDGRRMTYGTMGGEGQPQTQAAVFSRFIYQQQVLQKAVTKGRWLLGRTWGEDSHNLKLEGDIAEQIGDDLKRRGHDVAIVSPCNELMGHAGAIVLEPNGKVTAATDPRSDGKAFSANLEQTP